jgi:hypothetical protein
MRLLIQNARENVTYSRFEIDNVVQQAKYLSEISCYALNFYNNSEQDARTTITSKPYLV